MVKKRKSVQGRSVDTVYVATPVFTPAQWRRHVGLGAQTIGLRSKEHSATRDLRVMLPLTLMECLGKQRYRWWV